MTELEYHCRRLRDATRGNSSLEIPTDALTMQDCQPTLDAYRMAIGVTADGRAILFHKTIGYWP